MHCLQTDLLIILLMSEEAEEEPKQVNSEATDYLLDKFFFRFVPADSSNASLRKSTNEILEMLSDHCPHYIQASDVYDALIARGYDFEFIDEGTRIVWLLNYKKD